MATARDLRFRHIGRGVREITLEGVTYRATWYRSGGRGTSATWIIQTDPPSADYEREGNNWYESSWRQVRAAIRAHVTQRLAQKPVRRYLVCDGCGATAQLDGSIGDGWQLRICDCNAVMRVVSTAE